METLLSKMRHVSLCFRMEFGFNGADKIIYVRKVMKKKPYKTEMAARRKMNTA